MVLYFVGAKLLVLHIVMLDSRRESLIQFAQQGRSLFKPYIFSGLCLDVDVLIRY